MSTPYSSSILESFHDRDLLTSAGLRRWLMRVPQAGLKVRQAIEQGHARWIDAIKRDVARLVNDIDRSPLDACRNAIATVDPAHLAMWRHALDFGALAPFGDQGVVEPLLAAAEARWPADRSVQTKQLRTLAAASSAAIPDLLQAVRLSWLLWLAVLELLPGPRAAHELLVLLRGYQINRFGRHSHDAQRINRLMLRLVPMLKRRADVRFSASQFAKLPPEWIERIKDESLLLTADAIDDLARARRRKAERDRAFEAQDAAKIASACAELSGLLDAPQDDAAVVRACWLRLARALRALILVTRDGVQARSLSELTRTLESRRAKWVELRGAPQQVLRALTHSLAPIVPPWLAFLAMSRDMQCRSGWPAPPQGRRNGNAAPPADLKATVDAHAIQRYIRTPKDRARLWDSIGPGCGESPCAAWNPAFLVERKLASHETHAVFQWMTDAPQAAQDAFDKLHERWLLRSLRQQSSLRELLSDARGRSLRAVLGVRNPARFDAAFTAACRIQSTKERLESQRRLWALLRDCDRGRCMADAVASQGVARFGVARTIALLGPALDARRLAALFTSVGLPEVRRSQVASLFRGALQRDSSPLRRAMLAVVRIKDRLSDALVEGMWRGAIGCGVEKALQLAVLRPAEFMSRAVEDVPHAMLLTTAVTHPTFGAAMSEHLGDDAIRVALPDARKRLARRPMLRGVLELAAMTDLAEVGLLRQLARTGMRDKPAAPGHRFDSRYRTYALPKRSGGTRTIAVPEDGLMRLQRRLLAGALGLVPLHDAAHGFRRGRSILTNAKAHVGHRLVVNVDIKGFFPSTRYPAVLAACLKADHGAISVRGAKLLAEICCYQGALPTGAPTSPVIANIVLQPADAAIAAAAAAHGITYTRYADDLTFSGGNDTKRIIPFVKRVLQNCGYELDAKKTQLYRRGRQQLVTNLVVNDKANLRRSDRRRLRAAVNRRCEGGTPTWHDKPMDDAVLSGRIALLNMIEAPTASAYLTRLRAEAPEWGMRRG